MSARMPRRRVRALLARWLLKPEAFAHRRATDGCHGNSPPNWPPGSSPPAGRCTGAWRDACRRCCAACCSPGAGARWPAGCTPGGWASPSCRLFDQHRGHVATAAVGCHPSAGAPWLNFWRGNPGIAVIASPPCLAARAASLARSGGHTEVSSCDWLRRGGHIGRSHFGVSVRSRLRT